MATNKIKEQREISESQTIDKLVEIQVLVKKNNRLFLTETGKLFFGEERKPNNQITTSYFDARREWDERMGYAVARESLWRKVAFVCLAIVGIETIGYVYTATRSHIEPYLIAQDKIGTITPLGIPHKLKVDQAATEYFLRSYITALRSFWSDEPVNSNNIDIITSMTAQSALAKMQGYTTSQQANPQQTSVVVTNVQPMKDSNSYQVDWTEMHPENSQESPKYWRALLELKDLPKTDQDAQQRYTNPFGLTIVNLSITPRLSQ